MKSWKTTVNPAVASPRIVGICRGVPKITSSTSSKPMSLCPQVENDAQRLPLPPVMRHMVEGHLEGPASQDGQQNNGRDPGERPQHQVEHDLVLQLYLIAPADVERNQLLLRAQPVVEDAQDSPLAGEALQLLDPGRIRLPGCLGGGGTRFGRLGLLL